MEIEDIEYSLAKRVPDMAGGFCIETSYGDISIRGGEAGHVMTAVRQVLEHRLAPDATCASYVPAATVLDIAKAQHHGVLEHGRGAAEMCAAGQIDWLSAFNRIASAQDAMTVGCSVLSQVLAYATPAADRELAEIERLQLAADAELDGLKASLPGDNAEQPR